MSEQRERVPVRAIATAIAMVLATALGVYLLVRLHRAVTWLLVAAFLTVLADAVVGVVERRLKLGRGVATGLVFVFGTLLVVGLATLFLRPLAREINQFATDLPRYVDQARTGRGPVGELITRFHLDQWVSDNQAKVQQALAGFGKPALAVAQGIASTVIGALVVLVLTIFMTLESPALLAGALSTLPAARRDRVAKVAGDCGRAVTGYMTGQLLIATICGVATYLVLLVLGVPFRGTVALFVALTDLIPLVGATIGAVVAVAVALLSSMTDGIVVAGWFLVYQQLENHLLQPVVQSRTVKLNPLTVLVSVIVGVELVGILGALLAIPVAGMISVIVRDLWDHRGPRPETEPTVGAKSRPVDGLLDSSGTVERAGSAALPTAQPPP